MSNPEARRLRQLLEGLQIDPSSQQPASVQRAVLLARLLQERAAQLQTAPERRQQSELDRMIRGVGDKETLVQITDQAFRSRRPHRAAEQLTHILDVQGIPRFFSPLDRALLLGFQSFGDYLPGVAMPLVKEKMHRETANVILPAERELLAAHLASRREQGLRMNVNYLGEALLGEAEAERRLHGYLEALQLAEIEVISIKISTIYSQTSASAREHTVEALCDRLELLYRAASKLRFTRADGTAVPKFVYLDMEEYRDMTLTADAFMRTLDRPGLEQVQAGLALQAYIPDAHRVQRDINGWARRRVAAGGAPVTIRLVKGANMDMERVEASLHGWPQAPFKTKVETDANYKRMLRTGMERENLGAVHLGIASHNLFDLAYGLVLAVENDALDRIQFEMLEGMANAQRRALFEQTQRVLLYAPACGKENFIHAIGYLFRRLDENTGPENFLRHAFRIHVGSEAWDRLERGFLEAFDRIETVSDEPRRSQDRSRPPTRPAERSWPSFVNEPDTDWSLAPNAAWAQSLLDGWRNRCGDAAAEIPIVIDGEEIFDDRECGECLDPSRPGTRVGRHRQAGVDDVERAVACARADRDGWRSRPQAERSALLREVAHEIRGARADLMGATLADAGKILTESDPEVSEAVDFVEFYANTAQDFHTLPGLAARGKGVVVVVPPWNFPIAIPCGGIAAALAAGNTVILKPAPETVLVAWELCRCFWRAGISQRTLQFAPCPEAAGASRLVRHGDVDAVILTGATETARLFLGMRPEMHLVAETGGKNATVVTALSDRDLAVKHVVHSAFSHAGQKCSATSLLLLEEEVYEDPDFRRVLCDAAESMAVGSAWELSTRVGPLIRPPSGPLERGLEELEPGESWASMPRQVGGNTQLWTPGIKWDVQPGSFTHVTELFGPVLGVMKFRHLSDAIALVNQTGYGLTSGLESLDDREQELWVEGIQAGNLYVNRTTVGAIVLRQPFGGTGKSAFGPGIKAGGPNYVAQFIDFETTGEPPGSDAVADPPLDALRRALAGRLEAGQSPWPEAEVRRAIAAIGSYDRHVREEFSRSHDHAGLIGQDNLRRYRPVRELRVRVEAEDGFFELFGRVCAARAAGCRVTVSLPPGYADPALDLLEELTQDWAAEIEFVEESDEALARAIREGRTERVRYSGPERVPSVVREAVAATGRYVADAPVLAEGRVELLWYLREQSLSIDYHRYGNLGARASEERADTL